MISSGENNFHRFFNPFSCPSSIFTQSTGDDEKCGFTANDDGDENLSNHPFNQSIHQGKGNLAFRLLPTCHNGDDDSDGDGNGDDDDYCDSDYQLAIIEVYRDSQK